MNCKDLTVLIPAGPKDLSVKMFWLSNLPICVEAKKAGINFGVQINGSIVEYNTDDLCSLRETGYTIFYHAPCDFLEYSLKSTLIEKIISYISLLCKDQIISEICVHGIRVKDISPYAYLSAFKNTHIAIKKLMDLGWPVSLENTPNICCSRDNKGNICGPFRLQPKIGTFFAEMSLLSTATGCKVTFDPEHSLVSHRELGKISSLDLDLFPNKTTEVYTISGLIFIKTQNKIFITPERIDYLEDELSDLSKIADTIHLTGMTKNTRLFNFKYGHPNTHQPLNCTNQEQKNSFQNFLSSGKGKFVIEAGGKEDGYTALPAREVTQMQSLEAVLSWTLE